MIKKLFKRKKAFSIIELIVSLGVISIILVIFFNSLIISLQITYKNINRSALREEATTIVNLIARDLRNADQVTSCSDFYCEFEQDSEYSAWGLCSTAEGSLNFITFYPSDEAEWNNIVICKLTNGVPIYESSSFVKVQSFKFETGFSNILSRTRANYVFTLIVEHSNEELKINNVVRQASISLRNYEL